MQRGTDIEPDAREAYEFENLVVVEEVAFITHPKLDYVGMSPDGLVNDDGLIEIKVPSATSSARYYEALMSEGEEYSTKDEAKSYAKEYWTQVQGQLWVADRTWCDVCVFWPEAIDHGLPKLIVNRVYRDEKFIKELEKACIAGNKAVEKAIDMLRSKVKWNLSAFLPNGG